MLDSNELVPYSAHDLPLHQLRVAVAGILYRFPKKYIAVLSACYGIDSPELTIAKTIEQLNVSESDIRYAKARALRMLLHPAQQDLIRSIVESESPAKAPTIEVKYAVESIQKLTPDFVEHLRKNNDDLHAVQWDVFEHIVAELMASAGFHDVSLIGRDSSTAADIFAAWKVGPLGSSVRYFVEVKRWKDRVGVEIIDRVHGAMLAERPTHGWHAALIVSLGGFKEFQKYDRPALRNLGVELKDKQDILSWLEDYQPDTNGLWLPKPKKGIIGQNRL